MRGGLGVCGGWPAVRLDTQTILNATCIRRTTARLMEYLSDGRQPDFSISVVENSRSIRRGGEECGEAVRFPTMFRLSHFLSRKV